MKNPKKIEWKLGVFVAFAMCSTLAVQVLGFAASVFAHGEHQHPPVPPGPDDDGTPPQELRTSTEELHACTWRREARDVEAGTVTPSPLCPSGTIPVSAGMSRTDRTDDNTGIVLFGVGQQFRGNGYNNTFFTDWHRHAEPFTSDEAGYAIAASSVEGVSNIGAMWHASGSGSELSGNNGSSSGIFNVLCCDY